VVSIYEDKFTIEAKIKFYNKRIKILRDRLSIGATDFSKLIVDGGKKVNKEEDLVIQICDLEKKIIDLQAELDIINEHIDDLKNIALKYDDPTLEIIEYRLDGKKIDEIAVNVNLSSRTVQRRLKQIQDTNKL
jgi:AraC-like DNA-binding protein